MTEPDVCPRCADGLPTCTDPGYDHRTTCATYQWSADVCGPCDRELAEEAAETARQETGR